ncbi:uncharacterized protein BXZ73DRAFT_75562 [Epithele typhae]|uniref:uncharacterized protein n=1 Tax=Epithele typhae TaxID=378194 RepID=UPI00200796ED|nr:uncharacterized protein BXZ73DRAFT_75562 [Epithele typhae]KAH9940471.1 hypothetical protein BXZ73DRAFT_75562 [Epithele typhae]
MVRLDLSPSYETPHRMGKLSHRNITTLPPELLDHILEFLEPTTLYPYLTICHTLRPHFIRFLYRYPTVSSPSGMWAFARGLSANASSVRSLRLKGNARYSSTAPTTWILAVPLTLGPFIPSLPALALENVDGTPLTPSFLRDLSGAWPDLARLSVRNTRFLDGADACALVHAFPRLVGLELAHVRWPHAPPALGRWVGGAHPPPPPEQREPARGLATRVLPLRRLAVEGLMDEEFADVLRWADRFGSVREARFWRLSWTQAGVAAEFLKRLAARGQSLDCLELCPDASDPIVYYRIKALYPALAAQRRLRRLELQMSVDEKIMRWVPLVLESARRLPLTHVALEFTFDLWSAKQLSEPWREVAQWVNTSWTETLRQVTLTHHPVGNLVGLEDERVVRTLEVWFDSVRRDGKLDIQIGERYAD